MKLADIQTEILRQLDTQDPTHGGAVVVWHDPDRQFVDTVEELDLPGVEIMCEGENNLFELKSKLNENLDNRRILLYRPRARKLEGDWLADVEARSPQFAADYTAIQLRELGSPDTPALRDALRTHRSFLAKKTNIKKLVKLNGTYQSPHELEQAIMALVTNATDARPASILRAYVIAAQHEEGLALLEALEHEHLSEPFQNAVASWTGFTGDVSDASALTQHILLSALARDLPATSFPTLASCLSEAHADHCFNVLDDWRASGQAEELAPLCTSIENTLGLERLLSDVDIKHLAKSDVFPCIDALIIRALLSRLIGVLNGGSDQTLEPDVSSLLAMRRTTAWYRTFAPHYECILNASRMVGLHRALGGDIAPATAEQIWKSYLDELHLMDRWYRDLQLAFARARRSNEAYDLEDLLRACCDGVEHLYAGWFLRTLSNRWIDACGNDLREGGRVTGIPQQVDFHMSEVAPLARNAKRAWVIISDGLRYEVASELSERLERETQGVCSLSAMQAMLPSITKCGMAALLPAGTLAQRERDGEGAGMAVLVDGEEMPSIAARQKALFKHHSSAAAMSFDEFFNKMSKTERAERVGDAEVVYLYHNTIDAYGDKRETESKVFSACAESIDELAACIQLIVREFRASHVVVTADHGFLYTSVPLAETDHALVSDVTGTVVEAGRRYVVARQGATSEPFVPIDLPGSNGSLTAFAPRGCVRIRKAGGGENYVHGGISLQELCVPVLTFSNKRRGSKGFVEAEHVKVSLVNAPAVVTNSLFNVELLQSEPVGGKVLPAEYEIFAGDAAHTPVTTIARVAADRTDADPTARTSTVSLTLKSGASTSEHETYHIYARNAQTGTVEPLREVTFSVAFAPSIDFGW